MSESYGAAPAWPPMPAKPPTAGRGPWWRRHRAWLGLAAGIVVVGLVAGLLVWRGGHGSGPDRAPFTAALADLAAQPAIGYRTTLGTGSSAVTADFQVTYTGDTMGTVTVLGQTMSTLTINGTSYAKMPDLSGGRSHDPTGLAGRWVTGGAGLAAVGAGTRPTDVQTPAVLANRLADALDAPGTVLTAKDEAANRVQGTAAMKAATPAGDLYITRTRPYRLLRYAPHIGGADHSGLPSLPPMPSLPSMPGLPSGLPSGFPTGLPSGFPSGLPSGFPTGLASDASLHVLAPAPAGTLDLTELSPQDVDAFFHKLQAETKELRNTIDGDIHFDLKGSADLKCSAGGCRVTAHVSSDATSSDAKAKITGGQVKATLTATVEVEGEPAGGCTATRVLPLKGTSDIACEDAAAGAVFAEQDALKREEAEAESEAEGGAEVPYTVSSTGQAAVEAMAQVDVDAMLMMEQLEQQLLEQFRDTGPAPTATPGGQRNPQPSRQPSLAPTPVPLPRPSASPTPPDDGKGKERKKRKPTCLDRRPEPSDDNGPDGWTYYSPAGWRQRATGAVACLSAEATGGTKSNPDSPGMAEAKDRARRLFPHSPEKNLVNSCHLIPRDLGGRGIQANLSPCWRKPVNITWMISVQDCVTALMQSDRVVQLTVVPEYFTNEDRIPFEFRFTVEAWDRQGDEVDQNCAYDIPNMKDGEQLSQTP